MTRQQIENESAHLVRLAKGLQFDSAEDRAVLNNIITPLHVPDVWNDDELKELNRVTRERIRNLLNL
jgi:hypothetical protein